MPAAPSRLTYQHLSRPTYGYRRHGNGDNERGRLSGSFGYACGRVPCCFHHPNLNRTGCCSNLESTRRCLSARFARWRRPYRYSNAILYAHRHPNPYPYH